MNDCKAEFVVLCEADGLTEEDGEFAVVLVIVERGEWDTDDMGERVSVIIGDPVNVFWYDSEYSLEGEDEIEPDIELEPDGLVIGVRVFEREVVVVCE